MSVLSCRLNVSGRVAPCRCRHSDISVPPVVLFQILSALSVAFFAIELYRLAAGAEQLLAQLAEVYPQEEAVRLVHQSRTLLVVRLCGSLVCTAFSVALVVGVLRGNRWLVLSFVVLFGLYMAVSTAAVFYAFYDPAVVISEASIIELRKQNVDLAKAVIYISLGVALGIYAFLWYLAVVVYSYYKEMVKRGPTIEHRQLY